VYHAEDAPPWPVNTFQFYFFLWVGISGYWMRYMDQVFEAATTGGVLNTHSCHSGLIFEPEISARRDEQSIQAVLRVPQRK
jgi:hypothetical protein